MKQPYRDLKVTGSVVDATVERLLAERDEANAADPAKAYPLLIEEVLDALNISRSYWDKYRDFSDNLLSPDNFTESNQNAKDKDYKVYIALYTQRIELQKSIKNAEIKLGIGVIRTGFINPKLQTYCIWLSKQKYYGGYSDRADGSAAGDVKISIKLLDDMGRQM